MTLQTLVRKVAIEWPRLALDRIWRPLRERYVAVADLRFNIALLAVGTVLVCAVPQGRDVMATLSDAWLPRSGSRAQWMAFIVAVIFLGFQTWLWSRLLIEVRHGGRSRWGRSRLLVQLPRLLGLVPYLAAALALMRVPGGSAASSWAQAAALLALGVLAYVLAWKRYAITARFLGWDKARYLLQNTTDWGLTRLELIMLGGSLATSLLAVIVLVLDPVTVPVALGAAALAFLAFALVIPVVSVLIALTAKERFPVVTVLAVLAMAASLVNDNHGVRTGSAHLESWPRPTLDEAYAAWAAQAPRLPDDPEVAPLVIVSSAGGASRAALWTLATLQRLDAASPTFNRSVFAINAVSGGALGAVDYVTAHRRFEATSSAKRNGLAWRHASGDFLAPAIGGLFYTDMIQRFVPWPVFADRAVSLERGFERIWDTECASGGPEPGCEGLFAGPFLGLWTGRSISWRPNLLLVGALEEDGRRIVTSNIDLMDRTGARSRQPRPLLPNTYDFFQVVGRPISTSTAITNSARFPWISPAGGLFGKDGTHYGHVIDGGYYEASASDTSVDLAAAIMRSADRYCADRSDCVRPRVIFLTLLNDELVDDRPAGQRVELCQLDAEQSTPEARIAPEERALPRKARRLAANDLLAPLRGLFSTQGGRAEVTLARLARQDRADNWSATCAERPVSGMDAAARRGVPEIRIAPCRKASDRPMAMSWALSAPTRQRMLDQLRRLELTPNPQKLSAQATLCTLSQQREMARLAYALGIPPGAAPR